MFERWIRCAATHLILHFQLHRCGYFVCTYTFPKPIIDPSYLRIVICHLSHKLQLKYIQRIRCLVYFPPLFFYLFFSLSLSRSVTHAQCLDAAIIPKWYGKNSVSLYDFYHDEKPPDEQFKPILFFILFSLRSQMTQRNGGITPDKRYLYSFIDEHLYAPCYTTLSVVTCAVCTFFFLLCNNTKKCSLNSVVDIM